MMTSKSPRVVFMGSPEFALASLDVTVARCQTLGVFCQPDRPAGRGRKLRAPAVKTRALELGLPVHQPERVREPSALDMLAALDLDLIVVAAYGQIFPQALLDLPRFGCVNVHGSLLPRWRGAAPIQRAIMAGDQVTGISIMQMNAGCDTGPVHTRTPLRIADCETTGELFVRMARLGGEALDAFLANFDIEHPPVPADQDESLATHAAKIAKHEAWLDWSASADQLARQCRGLDPAPGARARVAGREFKLFSARPIESSVSSDTSPAAGAVVELTKTGLVVATGGGLIEFAAIQQSGKRRLAIEQCWTALALAPGDRFEPLHELQSADAST